MKKIDPKSLLIGILFTALAFVSINATGKTDKWDENQEWGFTAFDGSSLNQTRLSYDAFKLEEKIYVEDGKLVDESFGVATGKKEQSDVYHLPKGWEVLSYENDIVLARKRIK